MAKRKKKSSQIKDVQISKQALNLKNDSLHLSDIDLESLTAQDSINIKNIIATEENYSGPLPSPEDLAQYKKLHPKALDVIFTLALNSQTLMHQHLSKRNEIQELSINSEYKIVSRGQIFAFILTLLFFFACIWCIYTKNELAAIIFGSVPFGVLVRNIIPTKKSLPREKNENKVTEEENKNE